MPRLSICAGLAAAACAASALSADAGGQADPAFGIPADRARLAAWDIDVGRDGAGLPPGKGSVQQGVLVYEAKCAACHGEAGEGQPADRLTGGVGTLRSARPIKTVASYWPYATTLFSYIRSAMPVQEPQSLTPDEVYAVTAYILSVDGIVEQDAVLDAESLAKVKMPNREGFRNVWDRSSR